MKTNPIKQEFLYSGYGQRSPFARNPIHRYGRDQRLNNEKPFEDYLKKTFQGQVVQDGEKYSDVISDIMKENLKNIPS